MIAKGNKSLPDDEEGRGQEPGSHESTPASPGVPGKGESVDEYPVIGGKRADARLKARAMRRRWPTTRRMRKRCVEQVEEMVESENPTLQIEGVTLALRMEGQNQKDDIEPPKSVVNVGVQVNIGETVRQVLKDDPEYIDYLESKRLDESSTLGGKGVGGTLATGSALGGSEPGAAESRHGQN